MAESSRQRLVLATVVVFALTFSGCLTLNPTVVTTDTNNSAVFEEISARFEFSYIFTSPEWGRFHGRRLSLK